MRTKFLSCALFWNIRQYDDPVCDAGVSGSTVKQQHVQGFPIKCGNQCIREKDQAKRKECNGECLPKSTTWKKCNGVCEAGEKECGTDQCTLASETSVSECNGKCKPSHEPCNGECNQVKPQLCEYNNRTFCALADIDCKEGMPLWMTYKLTRSFFRRN